MCISASPEILWDLLLLVVEDTKAQMITKDPDHDRHPRHSPVATYTASRPWSYKCINATARYEKVTMADLYGRMTAVELRGVQSRSGRGSRWYRTSFADKVWLAHFYARDPGRRGRVEGAKWPAAFVDLGTT